MSFALGVPVAIPPPCRSAFVAASTSTRVLRISTDVKVEAVEPRRSAPPLAFPLPSAAVRSMRFPTKSVRFATHASGLHRAALGEAGADDRVRERLVSVQRRVREPERRAAAALLGDAAAERGGARAVRAGGVLVDVRARRDERAGAGEEDAAAVGPRRVRGADRVREVRADGRAGERDRRRGDPAAHDLRAARALHDLVPGHQGVLKHDRRGGRDAAARVRRDVAGHGRADERELPGGRVHAAAVRRRPVHDAEIDEPSRDAVHDDDRAGVVPVERRGRVPLERDLLRDREGSVAGSLDQDRRAGGASSASSGGSRPSCS